MRYYLAPLDGITNYIYRNAYHRHFEKMDKYFSPFISTDPNSDLNIKEMQDILPENQLDQYLVPQILANNSREFIKTANAIHQLGYKEINLNLGCPSKAVSARNKGSAFLYHKEALDHFLEDIFTHTKASISIKTRLGKYEHDEFYELAEIFSKYPMIELIIHPRVQKDMYMNTPNWQIVREVYNQFNFPVCLNGDLFKKENLETLSEKFPENQCIMLGRGIIANPNLLGEIKSESPFCLDVLESFHNEIYDKYRQTAKTEKKLLNVMKSLWNHMLSTVPSGSELDRSVKTCTSINEYEELMIQLFRHQS